LFVKLRQTDLFKLFKTKDSHNKTDNKQYSDCKLQLRHIMKDYSNDEKYRKSLISMGEIHSYKAYFI
jgi:hypothetical protein